MVRSCHGRGSGSALAFGHVVAGISDDVHLCEVDRFARTGKPRVSSSGVGAVSQQARLPRFSPGVGTTRRAMECQCRVAIPAAAPIEGWLCCAAAQPHSRTTRARQTALGSGRTSERPSSESTRACSQPIDKSNTVPEGTPPAPAAWDDRVIFVPRYVPYAAGANLQGKEVSRRNASVHQHSSYPFPPRG